MKFALDRFVMLAFAFVPIASQAQSQNPLLVFTEESDTVLTAKIGGVEFGVVSQESPDHWFWSLGTDRPPFTGSMIQTGTWREPNTGPTPTMVNFLQATLRVDANNNTVLGIGIVSDLDITGDTVNIPRPDSAMFPGMFAFQYQYNGTWETFDVQFIDRGDARSVPEGGPGLAGISLATALLLGWRRCCRK